MTHPYESPLLDVASDAAFDAIGDAYDGGPLKVAPSLAQIKQGVRPGRQHAAEYQNWKERAVADVLTVLRDSVQALPAINWHGVYAGSLGTITRVVFDPLLCRWWMMDPSDTDAVYSMIDGSPSVVDHSTGIAAEYSGSHVYDVATDGGRIHCFAITHPGTPSNKILRYGGTWNAVLSNNDNPASPSVAHSSAAGMFCCVYRAGAEFFGTSKVFTSPDGTTWTSRTSPFPVNIGDMIIRAIPGTGRLVWVVQTTSTTWKWATSDNGGVSWTLRGAITYTGEWSVEPSLSVDAATGDVYMAIEATGSPNGTRIYKSGDNGETFDLWAFVAGTKMARVAALGGLVIGVTTGTISGGFDAKGDVLYAPPSDGEFRRSGVRLIKAGGDDAAVFGVGPSGFLAVSGDGTFVWRSMSIGTPAVPTPI